MESGDYPRPTCSRSSSSPDVSVLEVRALPALSLPVRIARYPIFDARSATFGFFARKLWRVERSTTISRYLVRRASDPSLRLSYVVSGRKDDQLFHGTAESWRALPLRRPRYRTGRPG